ncbi:peptidase M17 leucyl aminopeptidase domain-containing protein [Arthrobacter crystallopoietes BAB-32]|uniref:Probable cytosol aminopeptidase n=1 Tax=Arthrobacter crystallopoietes BAB-32 TaxID=1246476 RepID=N1UST1_9MICC|nr:leucyl aminopeptidase family protein [Arthrobacter crystallopoietes]EMY33476.1 peptidase M17 leucyl aminopeptidase domain-containing protein [Arthrobacter crystallopoietes BAB-32]
MVHSALTPEEQTARALEEGLVAAQLPLIVPRPSRDGGAPGMDPGADVFVVPVAHSGNAANDGERATPQPRRGAAEAAARYGVDVAALAEVHSVTGKAGEILTATAPRHEQQLPKRLLFLGVGDESLPSLRKAGAALAKATYGAGTVRTSVADGLPEAAQQAFIEGFLLGGYRPPRAGTAAAPQPMAAALELSGTTARAVAAAAATGKAVWLARNLANMPSNVKNPAWVAAQAERLAEGAGFQVRVRDEGQLVEAGFGGLLAVGSASQYGSRLVQLSYTPSDPAPDAKHVVLVGKGITFDTGGISLKPREAMVPMKTDMAGAGVVLAVLSAAAELGIRHRVTGLLALAENAIGAASYRPGDVVTTYGGRTVEIGNTDAEGRMVLADALAYAEANLAPDELIDIATLTGAASLGLGRRHAALYATAPELVAAFEAAGEASGERVWHMPLAEVAAEYRFSLESEVADLSHISAPAAKVQAGSITAALFLREFVGDVPWVHLDIAGPARAASDEAEVTKGATGYGARLLLSYLSA